MQLEEKRKEQGQNGLLEEISRSGATSFLGEPKDTSWKKMCDSQSEAGRYSDKIQDLGEDGYSPWLLVSKGRRNSQGKLILNELKKTNDEEVGRKSRVNWVRKESSGSGKDTNGGRKNGKENRGNYWKLLPSREDEGQMENSQLTGALKDSSWKGIVSFWKNDWHS